MRPVNIRADLMQIADLLEICFPDMDSSGRAAIQEMRIMARLGPLLWLLQSVDRMVRGLMQGFVWIEDGQIIGNVSIYPAGFDQTWVVANVAVHPDYRQRGIAYQLCQAAIERIQEKGGESVVLQVDADNETAKRLYQRLGFHAERTFTRWRRSGHSHRPNALPDMPDIRYRSGREWRAALHLAETVRPDVQGGMGWGKPAHRVLFRPGFWRMIGSLLSSKTSAEFIIRGADRLDALLMVQSAFGTSHMRFNLLVHPDQQGQLEEPVVNFLLRYAADRYRGVLTDHPTDDITATLIFEDYGFTRDRVQTHMRYSFADTER